MMADRTIHAIIEGRVQGVYFRDHTRQEALRLGLQGWVRNLPNGAVEALITGEDAEVDQMIAWLHRGSPRSIVSRVIVTENAAPEELSGFSIRY
jgi:acylphosphatase